MAWEPHWVPRLWEKSVTNAPRLWKRNPIGSRGFENKTLLGSGQALDTRAACDLPKGTTHLQLTSDWQMPPNYARTPHLQLGNLVRMSFKLDAAALAAHTPTVQLQVSIQRAKNIPVRKKCHYRPTRPEGLGLESAPPAARQLLVAPPSSLQSLTSH